MKKTKTVVLLTRKAFDRAMDRLKGEDVDLYALFCLGFKTGYNYRRKEDAS